MLINRLNIQRFRGISSSLELDLSAPLTVIYAPNGTGKTSICDAVEWILCGSIGRLSSLDGEDVRCRFGDDNLETFVEADIPYLNEPFSIKRVLNDSSSRLLRKVGSGDYKPVDDQELLRLIVSAIPPSGNSAKAKVAWVRSTRFLESDSLSLLIDSDKESNDTRKLIFSNLFGVSEYQKAESDLNKILNKLPAASTITREKVKINTKISDYEESIRKLSAEQSAPYRDQAANLLNSIAGRLNQRKNFDKEINLYEYHNILEVKYIQSLEKLAERKSYLLFVLENVARFRENILYSEAANKAIESDNAALEFLDNSLKNKQQELKDKIVISHQKEELIREILNTLQVIKTEKIKWNPLHEIYVNTPIEVNENESRAAKISDYVASGELKITHLKEKTLSVDNHIQLIPSLLTKREQLNGVEIELEALQARQPKDDDQIPLAEQVSKVKAALDSLQASREKALGEIELLLSSGKRYIETHSQDSECPLCEHKYESNLVLQEKIHSRFSKLSNKSKEEASLVSKLEVLTQHLVLENNRLRRFEELIVQRNQLENEIQIMEVGLIAIGIKKSDLSLPGAIAEQLNFIREQHLNAIEELTLDIAPYKRAYDAFNKLEEIRIQVQSLASLWRQRLGLHYELPFSIDNLGESLDDLETTLEKQSSELKLLHEDIKPVIQKLSDELSKLEEEKRSKYDDISASKKKLIPIENALQDFRRRWAAISNAEDISDAEIEKVIASIAENDLVFNEVKSLFAKAEEYFVKIREFEKKESEQGLCKKELKEAQEQLREWQNQEKARSIVEKEITRIKEEIRRFVAQEIRPLSNIINTLYLRAQGNRFINSIEARPSKESFLEWIAELNEQGESFDKMLSLSQGQRQDLALAIFLARARSLVLSHFCNVG